MITKTRRIFSILIAVCMIVALFPCVAMAASPDKDENGNLLLNSTNFSDANFLEYLKSEFDNENNGYLTQTQVDEIKEIYCSGRQIKSLEGIQYFSNLEVLICDDNIIESIDVSKNTNLEYLSVYENKISSLDISNNEDLISLDCGLNELKTLHLSNNSKLEELYCDCNLLTGLDVSKNTALETLYCSYNYLTKLDVSKNVNLSCLYCENNRLTVLDLSNNTMLNFEDLLCDTQHINKIQIKKIGNSYQADLKAVVGAENLGKITRVEAWVGDDDVSADFDSITGIATFSAEPVNITYTISTGFEDVEMVVTDEKRIIRVEGRTRFETSAKISQAGYEDDGADYIVIVDGMNFPDALAATPIAYILGAPILMVNGQAGTIDNSVLDEIQRIDENHDARILIVGGPTAVKEKVVDTLKELGYPNENIARAYGQTRFGTAIDLAMGMKEISPDITTAYIANGMNYPDALVIGSAAAINDGVILFTRENQLPEETADYLKSEGFESIVILGGEFAVSKSVEDELNKICDDVTRISGENRFLTSVKIAEEYFPNSSVIFVATGFNFADALAGGPLAAYMDSPIILLNTYKQEITPEIADYIRRSGAEYVVVLGGELAVSAELYEQLEDIIY